MNSYCSLTNVIRGLSKAQYDLLREMCRYSNNLYNVALYSIRQHYFNTKQYLNYNNNYHACKTNENYGLLQAGISQQILKIADRDFKSFFALLKKCKTGDYKYQDVKIPHYKSKGGMFNLIMSTNAFVVKNGYLYVPMSKNFKALHPDANIKIVFPERLSDKTIKEVHIIPFNNGRHFKIQYIYEVEQEEVNVDKNNILSIDLGIDNLATCVSTVGTPFIMDGRKLKSINHQWNKELARLSSIFMKQKNMKGTKRIQDITTKRNNRVDDIIKKSARYIINYCIKNSIGTLIVGYNTDFKRGVNIGKVNNQNFVQIPLISLLNQLEFLCWKYQIDYIKQEESYTSKSSFLDKDALPEYKEDQPYKGTFSGKRIERGLYRSKNGTIINADVNGAANILRKSKQNVDFDKLCIGLMTSPTRIRIF